MKYYLMYIWSIEIAKIDEKYLISVMLLYQHKYVFLENWTNAMHSKCEKEKGLICEIFDS